MTNVLHRGAVALCCCALFLTAACAERAARWEQNIAKFEQADATNPPPKEGILFLGSSSIRMWDLDRWFPGMDAINRGFGGSEIADSTHFADRIVLPYAPEVIVFYAGDNDIAGGKKARVVAEDFKTFAKTVWEHLPETRIVYIAIKPSIARWSLVEEMRKANQRILTYCATEERLTFVDVDTPMLGEDGKPRPTLFGKDGLHLSDAGYALWTKLVMPHLAKEEDDG